MKRWLLAVALVTVPVSAQAMTVQEFLTRVAALKAKGIMALMSPEVGRLKGEVGAIQKAWESDQAVAKRAGRPLACPAKGQRRMSQDEFLTALEGIPPAQRGVSMKTAFYAILKQRYPCGG